MLLVYIIYDIVFYTFTLVFFRLGGSCNHIAAAFFKLDYISTKEPYKESCTDGACNWKKSTKQSVVPTLLIDIKFVKPNYSKGDFVLGEKKSASISTHDTDQGIPLESWVAELMDILPSATYLVDKFDSSPDVEQWKEDQRKSKTDGRPMSNQLPASLLSFALHLYFTI